MISSIQAAVYPYACTPSQAFISTSSAASLLLSRLPELLRPQIHPRNCQNQSKKGEKKPITNFITFTIIFQRNIRTLNFKKYKRKSLHIQQILIKLNTTEVLLKLDMIGFSGSFDTYSKVKQLLTTLLFLCLV